MEASGAAASARGRRSSLPPGLARWVAQARRDARMLLDGLRGRHPHPLIRRRARQARELRAGPRMDGRAVAVERASQPPLRRHAPDPGAGTPAIMVEAVRVHIRGRTSQIAVQPGETILEAALDAGLPMPFSCAAGGCGTCKVKLRAGDVVMEEPSCLTAAEREDGYVLACVSRPAGPVTIEVEPR